MNQTHHKAGSVPARIADVDVAQLLRNLEEASPRDSRSDLYSLCVDSLAVLPELSAQADEVLALHRQLAGEKLRADQGWAQAAAKSRECIDLRERMAACAGEIGSNLSASSILPARVTDAPRGPDLPAIMAFARPDVERLGAQVAAGLNLMARGGVGMLKAFGLAQDQGDAGNPVSAQALDLSAERQAMLRTIIAAAYQVAGAHAAPAHILDVPADPEGATAEQVDAMLPYQPGLGQAQDETKGAGDAGAAQTCSSRDEVQAEQDAREIADIWDAATAAAAMYVEAHCVDGAHHAGVIISARRPVIRIAGAVFDPGADGKPASARQPDQLAFELPTGDPVIRNVGRNQSPEKFRRFR